MKPDATATHDVASEAPWSSLTPSTAPANSSWADIRPTAAAKTNALTLQLKATNAFKESLNSDDDSDDDSDEEDVDYWPDPGAERYQLFRRIFVEDGELRKYFEENHKAGEFFCFVCGGIGKRSSGRSFKSCQGLLQHVVAMSKVERSQSHRAFGLVVCKVLGWDFDQIPSVVLKGEPLGRTLGGNSGAEKQEIVSGDVKDNVEVPSENGGSFTGNEIPSGKGESVGDVATLNMKVVFDVKTVEKEVFESNLQTADDKGCVVSKGGISRDDILVVVTSEAGGSETKSTIQPCSDGKARSGNQAKEEKASKDSDNEEEDPSEDGNEEEEEEEDPSEEEEEEEDPSENENEEEDPNEDEEDPCEEGSEEEAEAEEEEEEEDEDPSEDEDGDGNENKDENKGGVNDSTVSKSCSLDQPTSQLGITQPSGSSSEWPCGEAVVKNPSANGGWPVLTPKLAISLSPEEQAMLALDNVQRKAVKLCKDFLKTRSSLGSHDDNNEEEKEEEDFSEDTESENEGDEASENSKELNFFSKLFSEDIKLRDIYANDRGSRDFCCLVCGGVGKKDWKRFTSVALVQHSTAISKTRKKRAHRAYSEVVCGVLGWDKNRLPSIMMRSGSHGQDQPWMKLNAVCSVEGAI